MTIRNVTLQNKVYFLCLAIEEAGCSKELTECSDLANALLDKVTAYEKRLAENGEIYLSPYKFEKTWCSQCGKTFGPGNHGYSHCTDHSGKKIDYEFTEKSL